MTTREDAALLKILADISPHILCALTADGQFQQVSAACRRLLYHEPTELVGTLFLALIHPAYAIFFPKKVARCLGAFRARRIRESLLGQRWRPDVPTHISCTRLRYGSALG